MPTTWLVKPPKCSLNGTWIGWAKTKYCDFQPFRDLRCLLCLSAWAKWLQLQAPTRMVQATEIVYLSSSSHRYWTKAILARSLSILSLSGHVQLLLSKERMSLASIRMAMPETRILSIIKQDLDIKPNSCLVTCSLQDFQDWKTCCWYFWIC